MIKVLPNPQTALTIIMLAAVSGCGGGGSSAAPTAASSAVTIDEDVSFNGTLNASDPENDPLTFSIVSNGTIGSAVITNPATGTYTYTPNPDENGVDSFSFKANDGSSDSNTATVTVTILVVNDAPIAQVGNLVTNENTPAAGTLVATDAELQPLTYSIVSNGSQGTATITNAATGTYTYTPNPGANGSDSFTFRANDGLLDSNVATVTVSVNAAPIATGGCSTTPQAQTIAGTLNATDPETPDLLMYSLNADGSGGTGPISTSKGGIVTITNQTTGAFTYQPATVAGDRRGVDSFDYQVTDPDSGVASSTETIIVDQTIMPLGDSITAGTTTPEPPEATRVGYRKTLYDRLVADGFSFDFVGSLDFGFDVVPDFDSNHEGHGGWNAIDIAFGQAGFPTDGVRAWLDANPSDFILLHAGTNDFAATTDFDIEAILEEIELWEASASGNPVTVLLALIIDWDPLNPDIPAFNTSVLNMANNRIAAGDDIIVVNQHDALTYPADMADQLHPTGTGYDKMADTWFNALMNDLDKCP